MAIDRIRARRDFLQLEPVVRIQMISDSCSAITDLIVERRPADVVFEHIDSCSWLIEWAVPHEPPSTQAQLVELQTRLSQLRKDLIGMRDQMKN